MSFHKYQPSSAFNELPESDRLAALEEIESTGVETIAYSAHEISQSASLWAERATKFSPEWH